MDLADLYRNIVETTSEGVWMIDADHRRWGVFEASRQGQRMVVRERIYEASGAGSWTDVSSWYWAAALKRSPGPWWSVTVAEALLP